MQIIATLLAVLSFLCFLLVLIKQFRNAGVVHGIVGLVTCGIWTFIWGWINAGKLNLTSIMLVWTLLIAACTFIYLMLGAVYSFTPPTATPSP